MHVCVIVHVCIYGNMCVYYGLWVYVRVRVRVHVCDCACACAYVHMYSSMCVLFCASACCRLMDGFVIVGATLATHLIGKLRSCF